LIDGIRRRLKSMEQDPWDANQDFGPEVHEEPPADGDGLLPESGETNPPRSNEFDAAEYYKVLVRTAIEHGGRHGDHQISVPWLRMILAGLEFRRIDPEMMWYGFEADDSGGARQAEIPAYDDLFPSARQALASVR